MLCVLCLCVRSLEFCKELGLEMLKSLVGSGEKSLGLYRAQRNAATAHLLTVHSTFKKYHLITSSVSG